MTATAARRRWLGVALPAAILVAALAARAVVFVQLRAAPTYERPEGGDSIFYDRVARGHDAPPRAYFHSPLYRWFVGGVYAVFGRDIGALRVIQHLVGACGALVVYALALALFRRRALAGVAGMAVALARPLVFYEWQLLPDALLPTLLAATALAWLRYGRRPTARRAALVGVALGVTALARPTVLIWLPLLGLVAWRQRRRWRARARTRPSEQGASAWGRQQAALAAGLVLVIAPVTVRNCAVEGDLVLITANGGLNLYIGNNPLARGSYNLPRGMWFRPGDPRDDFAGIGVATRALGRRPSSAELSGWWRRRALAFLAREPGRGLWLLARKARLWFADYEHPQLYNIYGYARVAPALGLLPSAGVIIAPGLVGLLAALALARRRRLREYGWLVAAFALAFMPFFVVGRYRAAWLVLIAPLAAFAVEQAWWAVARWVARRTTAAERDTAKGAEARRHTWRGALGWLAALAAAVALCLWPLEAHPTQAPQLLAFGDASSASGDHAAAARYYRATLAAQAGHREATARLALALMRLGRPVEAKALLSRALARDGGAASLHLTLGRVLLAGRRDLASAERHAARALSLAPSWPRVWLTLARVKRARGDRAGAIEAYRSLQKLAGGRQPWARLARVALRQLRPQPRAPMRR